MKQQISQARIFAYKILYDVLIKGAFSNVAVNKHLSTNLKSDADRRLCVQIAYGTIKKENRLQKILSELSNRDEIHPVVKTILYMSLYQIMYLDKIPEYAIVNDAVNLCKFYKQHAAGGFVNGVLRNALRNKNSLVKKEENRHDYYFFEYGFPKWISKHLEQQYGEEWTKEFIQASEESADVFVRTNTMEIDQQGLIDQFEKSHIETKNAYVPNALQLTGNANIFRLDAFKQGLFFVQDLSGMIAGYTLEPQKDDLILDVCSAPGGKTFHASVLSRGAEIIACDISSEKLERLKLMAKQLKLNNIRVFRRDATVFRDDELEKYDKIICDVPCSGLGVVRRKPEILKRITQEHITELIETQKTILDNAVRYLKAGGTLVYSTCTVNRQENLDVVTSVIEKHPDVELAEIALEFPLQSEHVTLKNGYLQLTPMQDGTDGFFIAKLRKKN